MEPEEIRVEAGQCLHRDDEDNDNAEPDECGNRPPTRMWGDVGCNTHRGLTEHRNEQAPAARMHWRVAMPGRERLPSGQQARDAVVVAVGAAVAAVVDDPPDADPSSAARAERPCRERVHREVLRNPVHARALRIAECGANHTAYSFVIFVGSTGGEARGHATADRLHDLYCESPRDFSCR